MNELNDWTDNEVLTFYELVSIIRNTKYSNDSLLDEIQKLDTLRNTLIKFSFEKLDNLLSLLARVVKKRHERQEKT